MGRRRPTRTRRRHAHDRRRSPHSRAGGQSRSSGQAEARITKAMASTASAVAQRAILPSTVDEALDAYAAALMNRRQPSEATRRKSIHYARKAIRLMKAGPARPRRARPQQWSRVMLETMQGSDGERHLVFRGLDRFLALVRQARARRDSTLATRSTATKSREARRSRDHVPSLDELRAVWNAVENEPQRDLVRFLLLVPLAPRRSRRLGVERSRLAAAAHPNLSAAARKPAKPTNCHCRRQRWRCSRRARPQRKANWFSQRRRQALYTDSIDLLTRIRARIGHGDTKKAERFSLPRHPPIVRLAPGRARL